LALKLFTSVCPLLTEHKVEASVSLYSVGEYSLYNVLVNLCSSYTVRKHCRRASQLPFRLVLPLAAF
jgi:hypothetical protein